MRRPVLADIEAAAVALAGHVVRTPLVASARLSRLTGAEVLVKCENLQATGSFKERGAVYKLAALTADERRRGVIAMSAGNHAQAVALHAGRLGIAATIVMPVTTPHVKVEATRAYGAEVVLEGEVISESQAAAERLAAERGLVWVHPYDDFEVICGQATMALEMLADAPDLEIIVVPVGGGGMIAGMAVVAKALKPSIEIIGAETAAYPSMWAALRGEAAVCGGNTLAEGIAVKNVGKLPLAIARDLVDAIVLVGEAELEHAVSALATVQTIVTEGAGAAGLAAMFAEPERFRGKKVGLLISGGNIDARILASVLMRELAREERICDVRLIIPDRPGVLGDIASLIGDAGGNILEVSHRRTILDIPAKGASLDVTFEARDGHHAAAIREKLKGRGYELVPATVSKAGPLALQDGSPLPT
jgi:threonine dehydratase